MLQKFFSKYHGDQKSHSLEQCYQGEKRYSYRVHNNFWVQHYCPPPSKSEYLLLWNGQIHCVLPSQQTLLSKIISFECCRQRSTKDVRFIAVDLRFIVTGKRDKSCPQQSIDSNHGPVTICLEIKKIWLNVEVAYYVINKWRGTAITKDRNLQHLLWLSSLDVTGDEIGQCKTQTADCRLQTADQG